MSRLFELLGGRKLVLGFVVIVIGVLIDFFKPGGLSSNLLYLLCFISTSFFLANAANSIAYAKSQAVENQPVVVSEDADLTRSKLDLVQEQLNQTNASIATVSQAISHIIKKAGFDK